MFLMYIVADAVWIWMEPEALPSLQPVILGAPAAGTALHPGKKEAACR